MILHGNQRGGGKDLALHLMKDENERVQVHEIRGFMADTLEGAFVESYALSKTTRCKQHLYSLSISPPKGASITDEALVDATNQAERSLGLEGQPRAIVFHEKRGDDGELRRHAHAVWCRIDIDKMKAIELPYTKYRLRDVSRDLHIQHDLKMPNGLVRSKDRDPRNFSLEEWQQSKRAGKDVRQVKNVFRDCWAVSDSQASFAHALEEHGYFLAKGTRGHVAVDHMGEKYAVSRYAGLKAKQVCAKLGEVDQLATIDQAHAKAAQQVNDRLKVLKSEQRAAFVAKRHGAENAIANLRRTQKFHEQQVANDQSVAIERQKREHQARIRKGIFGLIDRLTGKRKRTLEQNTREALTLNARMEREKKELRQVQIAAQNAAKDAFKTERASDLEAALELKRDIRRIESGVSNTVAMEKDAFIRKRKLAAGRPRRKGRNSVEPRPSR